MADSVSSPISSSISSPPAPAAMPGAGEVSGEASGASPGAKSTGPVRAFLRLVVIEHSVFALPFAYLAALTAMMPVIAWGKVALITVAMVSGRTVAMAANRIIDRNIDAQNPRTAGRELVTGAVSSSTAWIGLGVALLVFLGSAAALNLVCLALSPLAIAALVVYSYAKRFTNYPQAFLALAQAVVPVGAWIAVTGRWSWPAALLGVAVGTWIGGFDCIYACQDYDADKRIGVGSVPVRWGIAGALRIARATHAVTVAFFAWFGIAAGFGWLWWLGLGLTVVVLGYEHSIVTPKDLSRLNRAFFTANGVVGIAIFAFALADLLLIPGSGQ